MSSDRLYLSVGEDPHGRGKLAVISRGHPQRGDEECEVLTIELVPSQSAAEKWFRRMRAEKPWETRQ